MSSFNLSYKFPLYSNSKDGLASFYTDDSPIVEARHTIIAGIAETCGILGGFPGAMSGGMPGIVDFSKIS